MESSAEQVAAPVHVLFVTETQELPDRVSAAFGGEIKRSVVADRDAVLDTVAAEPIDCVLVEHAPPENDAVAVATALRERGETVPILCVAASGSERLASEVTKAGATEYVPTDDADLLAERVRVLVQREREQQATKREHLRSEQESHPLESLVESAPLAIVGLDADGNVIRWNRGAEETFGWSSEEVVGEFNPIIPDERLPAFENRMERLLDDGDEIRGVEVVGETKNGDRVDLLLSATPMAGPDGELRSAAAVFNDITRQKRMERRLRRLQQTAQQLNVSPSIAEIGEIATDAAADVLGLEITGLWRYDDLEDALLPVSVTVESGDLIPEIPKFTPGNSLAWEVFETGEVRVYDDLRSIENRYNPETAIRSEILVPLGEYGVLVTGSTETQQFSESDIDLFRILGATVEAALVRANREEELRLQNERLDKFADVVAHDLRNPLSVAEGFLELAEKTGDPEQFAKVESALDRIGQLIDDLLTLAQGEVTVESRERIALGDAAERAWELVDTGRASLSVHEPPTVSGDPSRLRQLFENLFRNSVEHGGVDDVTVTVGALADDEGFYVEDDGSGIPPERRDIVLDHGVTFSDEGTGFGLSIVANIARAHGWTVSVTESEAGGARFEFRVDD
ncbi:MAG: PAS domain S-box protein [Halolamina sp.]